MLKCITVVLIILATQTLFSVCYAGEDEKAYQYFVEGQDAFEDGDLNKAKRLLEKALTIRGYDGRILINKSVKFRLIKGVRGIQRERFTDGDRVLYEPNKILKSIATLIAERRERHRAIAKSGKKPALILHSHLVDDDSDGFIQTEEPLSLHVVLNNQGNGIAEDVVIFIKNDHELGNVVATWKVGDVGANKTVEKVLSFTLSRDFDEDELEVTITTDERDGYTAKPLISTFEVIPWEQPKITINALASNMPLEAGKASPLVFKLINEGRYPVKGVQISPEFNVPGLSVIEQQWPDRYQSLPPGATRELNLIVKAHSDFDLALSPKINFLINDSAYSKNKFSDQSIASFETRVDAPSVRYQVGSTGIALSQDISMKEIKDGYAPKLTKNPISQSDSFALIIGNRDYSKLDLPVPYAINDANLMRNVFVSSVGIPEDQILQINNATLADLRTTLGSQGETGRLHSLLNNQLHGSSKTLYVYYSGHGIPAKNRNWSPYIMPSDANPDYIEHSGYSLDQLYNQLALVEAEQIVVFLDACFTGEQQNGLLFPNTSFGTMRPVQLPKSTKDKRIKVISAAGSDDMGLWLDQANQGLFTTYLARGLSGLADEGDKRLTLQELFNYVRSKVSYASARMARSQMPNAMGNLNTEIIHYGY